KEYHTVQSECLENYDPLHSDPPEFSREIFTGELNRYLLNSNNFVDPENRHLFPYDPKTWKSADELYHIFLGRAMEESEKKNFEIAISYLDFAQALDLEPTDHICLKNIKDVCDCVPKIVGINPGLALFRADLFLMLEKHYLAVIGSTYASMKFIEALKYCKQTNYFTTWVFCSKFVSETLNIMAYYESGAYSFVRNCLEDFEKCLNEFTDFLTDGSCEKNQMYKLRTCVLEIKKGLTGEKPDACIDKRIIDFIEADYEKMKQEFDNFNEPDECNQFGKIAKTLKKAGHHAWNSIFPTEFLLKEVQADIAQTAKIY
uniref:Uncharacterized protein n=1 Tax=Acrobeloides nanus TaxID=290746 RepID=A0A914EI28_9BILA